MRRKRQGSRPDLVWGGQEQDLSHFILYILPASGLAILVGGLLVFGSDRFGARRRHLEWLIAALGYALMLCGGLLITAWLS